MHGRIEISASCWTINDPRPFPANSLRGCPGSGLLCIASDWIRSQAAFKTTIASVVDRYCHLLSAMVECPNSYSVPFALTGRSKTGCHWVLDLAFREDESRSLSKAIARITSLSFAVSLSIFSNSDKTTKLGIKNKRLKAAWNHDYLFMLLSAAILKVRDLPVATRLQISTRRRRSFPVAYPISIIRIRKTEVHNVQVICTTLFVVLPPKGQLLDTRYRSPDRPRPSAKRSICRSRPRARRWRSERSAAPSNCYQQLFAQVQS